MPSAKSIDRKAKMTLSRKISHAKSQRRKDGAEIEPVFLFSSLLHCPASVRDRLGVNLLRITAKAVIALLSLLCLGLAADKPNFSGTWTLDKDKSFSNPPGLEQTMTITHSGDRIKLEGKQKSARGELDLNESYTLDGKETEFTPPSPPNAKGKRKAYWLPDNKRFLVEDEIKSESPEGAVTQHITRKWNLSTDGSTLTIDYYFDTPRGTFEAKRVFVKK
jgi:hypothetical protein